MNRIVSKPEPDAPRRHARTIADFMPKQRGVRAALGLGAGLMLALISALMLLFGVGSKAASLLLWLAALPCVGWGSANLASHRGYPGGFGLAVCIVGYVVSGYLGTARAHPLALAFIVLLPCVVLLSLPDRSAHARRPRR